MNIIAFAENSQFLLDRLMAHQNSCGSLEEMKEGGIIKCSRCGLRVKRDDAVPIIEGKGFIIEYH